MFSIGKLPLICETRVLRNQDPFFGAGELVMEEIIAT